MTLLIPENAIATFLNIKVVEMKSFFIDYWMFVHFFSGAIVGYFLDKKYWYLVLGFLFAYEIFEINYTGILFKDELIINRVLDIVVGMVGFYISSEKFRK